MNLQQLQSIIHGVVSVEQNGEWISFHRFTEAQTAMYRTDAASTDFGDKTFATAGVRLAFRTSSRTLEFDWRVKAASACKSAWFDVYENRELIAHFGTADEHVRQGHAAIPLAEGESDVEVYLPWSCKTELTLPVLTEGASLLPICRDGYTLFFGDSITHGYYTDNPSLTYPERLCRMLHTELVNKGIGGEHFRPKLAALAEPKMPTRIVVAYGTNDWNFHKREVLIEDFRRFLNHLSANYPSIPVYAVSPIWRTDGEKETPFGAPVEAVHAAMEEVCRDMPNVHLLCGWEMTPHTREYLSDFVHPNTQGFQAYADALCNAISKIEKNKNKKGN